jgi:hypothetical protein
MAKVGKIGTHVQELLGVKVPGTVEDGLQKKELCLNKYSLHS